jgi:hypothetical protein
VCTERSFSSPAAALAAVRDGLAFLNAVDAANLPAAAQAECLRGLARAESAHTAAHARMLAAFDAGRGYDDDGQGSARVWVRWQTRVTGGAAAGAVGWMRRLAAHPAVGQALAGGVISPSWAREICRWTDLLPGAHRGGADEVLLAAAAGGADLADLGGLAEEMRRRTAGPDQEPGGGFDERQVRLDVTFGGAGRLDGDLTPACAAALTAVLAALGAQAGPEDTRTAPQRRHDALEEACRRLTSCSCAPSTTSSLSTNGAGPSPCTATAPSPPPAPTAAAPCTATARLARPPDRGGWRAWADDCPGHAARTSSARAGQVSTLKPRVPSRSGWATRPFTHSRLSLGWAVQESSPVTGHQPAPRHSRGGSPCARCWSIQVPSCRPAAARPGGARPGAARPAAACRARAGQPSEARC